MKKSLVLFFLLFSLTVFSQQQPVLPARIWADSVLRTLTEDQKIAQLMVVRMSSMDASGKPVFYEAQVRDAILKYNIGGICLFQGGPVKQATVINNLQKIAKTPLFVSIDAENGLGMRMDSILPLPRQMMLGAVDDPALIYEYGRLVGEQCKRIGVQINYAPVIDINNNPANPVINDRSFGEDKYRVALLGMQYMRGMQDAGVMACAKHFPGQGDVTTDSHHDLPVIRKSKAELDSLELYPFRQIVQAGVGGVMVAHLNIPAIDNANNRASSISPATVQGLLREELGFEGLIFTDALEMKGVSKFASPSEISVSALEAGNDLLCLPGDIPGSIRRIKEAVRKKKLDWNNIEERVKKVLMAKYQYGLGTWQPVKLDSLAEDINARTEEMYRLIAQRSLTLLRNNDPAIFPLPRGKRVAYVGVGLTKDNTLARELRNDYDAHVYYFDYRMGEGKVVPLLDLLANRYDVVVVGVHRYNRFPGNDFGISKAAFSLIEMIQQRHNTITVVFGNPYAMKKLCDSRVLVAAYQDDAIVQETAADLIGGRFIAKGKLPVTVCPSLVSGQGIVYDRLMPLLRPADLGFKPNLLNRIDSIVNNAVKARAIPGGVVLVAKDGKIAYERAFGFTNYKKEEPVYPETIYDVASVTKTMATTLAVMKLYDEGRLDLRRTLGDYLPWVKGTNKEDLQVWRLLVHEAGLKSWIPFFRETLDSSATPRPSYSIYASAPEGSFSVRVAEKMYMRYDWIDTMYRRILDSELAPQGVYVYSDLDFIFLGKIVEAVAGMPLDQYVRKTFFDPLHLGSTTFLPLGYCNLRNIAPTEDGFFRRQQLRGDVHDPAAAMLGGVSGHAGLFSNAYDLAVLSQMLLNGGKMNGVSFFRKETVDLFTSYHGNSRRGLGFDKPEKDNATRPEPYPSRSVSSLTYGHTGFTGTCVWVDPQQNLIYIFLSNRVMDNGDISRFNRMNVRPKVHEVIYEALSAKAPNLPSKSVHVNQSDPRTLFLHSPNFQIEQAGRQNL